jgi:predicted nuclease with TOPRIM domain
MVLMKSSYEKRHAAVEKKFKELKRKTEIKERYGVFTQKMFEQLLEELHVRIKEDLKTELHSLDGKLDWVITSYKKFDEERILLSNKVTDLEERTEELEKNRRIVVQ